MIRTLILSFLMTTVAAAPFSPALASGSAEKSAKGAEADQSIDVQNLVVPVVRDGRLVNYLFLNARIEIAAGVDVWRQREKGHFLRDALIRAVHKRSLATADRFDQMDQAAARSLVDSVARQVLGPNVVASVQIVSVTTLKHQPPART